MPVKFLIVIISKNRWASLGLLMIDVNSCKMWKWNVWLFSFLLFKVGCLLGCWLSPCTHTKHSQNMEGDFFFYHLSGNQWWICAILRKLQFMFLFHVFSQRLHFLHFSVFFLSRDVYNKWTKSNKLHNSRVQLLLISRSFSTENDYNAVKCCELLWIHYRSAFLWKIRLWWSSQICWFSIKASADWINAAFVFRAFPLVWETGWYETY